MASDVSRRSSRLAELVAIVTFSVALIGAALALRVARPGLFFVLQWALILGAALFFGLAVLVLIRQLVSRSLSAGVVTLLILATTALAVGLLLRGQPLGGSWYDVVFHRNFPEYQQVALLVENGRFESDELYDPLPPEYAHIAPDGWVVVNDDPAGVYFPVVLGVVDNSEGFAYWSSSDLPSGCETFPGHCVADAQRIRPNWFRVWMT